MNTVFIDIKAKVGTVYHIGTQGDDKATKLVFTNLPEDGKSYAITLVSSESTFKNIPFTNNELVLSNKYTQSWGYVYGQIFVQDGVEWKVYSKVFTMTLDKQIEQEQVKPDPTTSKEFVYLPYKVDGATINDLGPCVIQNEKTDVVLSISGNKIDIDCFQGQVTLIKKVDENLNGDFGYFSDTYGKLNILSYNGSSITKRHADDLGHEWGFLSVSSDNKTLIKLDYVNGATTEVTPSSPNELVNKKYVDNELSQLSYELPHEAFGSSQEMNIKVWKAGLKILGYNGFKQKANFYFKGDLMVKFRILGGMFWVLKEYEHANDGDLMGIFMGLKEGDPVNIKAILVYKKSTAKTGIEWRYNETYGLNDFK